jgi:hypothetical protein
VSLRFHRTGDDPEEQDGCDDLEHGNLHIFARRTRPGHFAAP